MQYDLIDSYVLGIFFYKNNNKKCLKFWYNERLKQYKPKIYSQKSAQAVAKD